MTLNGSAIVSGSNLQLTSTVNSQVGTAWQIVPVSTARSFTTSFSFQLDGTPTQADGISFAMQNVGLNAIGGAGGGIGVEGLSNYVNLTIRTWVNNQIGFGNNALSAKAAPNALGSCSSVVGSFTVAYQAEHSVLALYGTYTACNSTFTVADSLNINLQAKFGSTMYVGFTGATGGAVSRQIVTAWSLNLTGDLVMRHQFDGSTGGSASANLDGSGNGFGGTFSGDAMIGATAPAYCGGNAWAKFSGGNRVQVPYHPALNPRPNFSVALWARVDGAQGTWRTPFTLRDEFPTRGFNLYASTGNQWQLWTGRGDSAYWDIVAAGTVVPNQWVHIAATYQATSGPDASGVYTGVGTLYINGVASATNSGMRYLPTWSNSLTIGAYVGGSAPFEGAVDDVRLYARTLSGIDIQNLSKASCRPGGLDGAVWWSFASSVSSGDNSDIVTWANEANASKNLASSAIPPKLRNNNAQNINFNPVVEFTSATATEAAAQYFTAPSMLGASTWNQGHYVLLGYPSNSNARNNVLWEWAVTPAGYVDGRLGMHFPWQGILYWDAGNCCSTNRVYYAPTRLVNSPSIYFAHMDTTSSAMPGPAKQGIRQDGVTKATADNPIAFTGNNQAFRVGMFGPETFQGVLAEGMLFLGRSVSATEVAQIESYLGVKYGLTLGDNGSTTYGYFNSTGAIIWSASTGYHNNIVGLGRDDITTLNQLISRSVNNGDQITVTTGTAMPSSASVINATTGGVAFATDRSFVIIGDNGQSATGTAGITVGPQAGRTRSARIWRLQMTGTVPTQLSICIPDTMLPTGFTAGDLWLSTATAADFSTGTAAATMTAATCVASGVGVTTAVPGRIATISNTVLNGMGGVGYFTVTRTLLDHVEVSASANTGVTCAPTTYTIKACGDATCSTLYTGGLTGTLTLTGAGVASRFPSGANFSIAAGSSSTTMSGQVTNVSTATVGATGLSLTPGNATPVWCGLGTTATSSSACSMNVSSAGLLFSVASHYAGASQTLSVKAVRSSDNAQVCLPAFANVTRTVKATCSYVNPSSGSVPVQLGSVKLNSGNTNSACDATGQNLNLAFDANGASSTTLSYWDAGKARLSLSYTGSAGTNDAGLSMTGSAEFVAAPMGFIVTDYPSVATAGSPFIFKIKALAWGADTNVLPNFGQESPREGVVLDWVRSEPLGVGSQSGSFSGTVGLFSGGVADVSNASWSEVGRISPTARLSSGSYLSSGLTSAGNPNGIMGWTHCASESGGSANPCVIPSGVTAAIFFGTGSYGYVKTGQSGSVPCSTANFGDPAVGSSKSCYYTALSGAGSVSTHIQVRPARIELSANAACGSFSYAGQPFGVTATAKNRLGAVTQNYVGTVARSVNLTDSSGNTSGTLSGSIPSSVFSLGVATVASSAGTAPVFSFSNKLTAPQTISVRATDTDGVSSSGYDGSQTLRSGRLQMSNAFGGDKTSLQIPLQLQYWSGKSWVLNGADTCTVIPTASVVRARTLNHNNTAATWSSAVGSVTLSGGSGFITLAAPSPNGTGTVDLALNLGSGSSDNSCNSVNGSATGAGVPWLRSRQGSCASTFDRDPSARGTFGVFTPETQRSVHVRELF